MSLNFRKDKIVRVGNVADKRSINLRMVNSVLIANYFFRAGHFFEEGDVDCRFE